MFNNKSVLITGGTGSFGRCCVRTLLQRFDVKRLVIFSRDEVKQHEMQRQFNAPCMRFFLGDVRDRTRLFEALHNVDYVIHAAALKQVPFAEYNPMECIKTNVHGAENLIAAALEHKAEKVIALSTDKAANPINLYGASKLASDKLFVAANNITGSRRSKFSVVRYGNVVGSRGSVVPYFRKLLNEGANSLPITDSRMTRFWISLQQGVEFVIDNFRRMIGGEIFVPKIPSVRIIDLAEAMSPGISLTEIGIRPGEKLHELMCPADDSHLTLEFNEYFIIRPSIKFHSENVDYSSNEFCEVGKPVPQGFEYNSGDNPDFLNVDQIRSLNKLMNL